MALFLGILGACLNTPPFKEITWASEMRKQCVNGPIPVACSLPFHLSTVKSMRWIQDLDLPAMSIEGNAYFQRKNLNKVYILEHRLKCIVLYLYLIFEVYRRTGRLCTGTRRLPKCFRLGQLAMVERPTQSYIRGDYMTLVMGNCTDACHLCKKP